ncbi:MAG TPA: hypothetical protein VGK99_16905 [Acidobacteriota bacterium]|jgi:hypothetical protein
MRRKRRIEVVLEAKEVIVIRGSQKRVRSWCSKCAEESDMITPDLAAVLSRTTTRVIYRWIECGNLHFTETQDGPLLVCRNSLPV